MCMITRSSRALPTRSSGRKSRKGSPWIVEKEEKITAAGRSSKRQRRLTQKVAENNTREAQKRKHAVVAARGAHDKENLDHDELQAGSRVTVLCELGKEWQATIKKPHERKGERGFKIHYDGMKRSIEYWVPVERVVGLLYKNNRRSKKKTKKDGRGFQPNKKRRLQEDEEKFAATTETQHPPARTVTPDPQPLNEPFLVHEKMNAVAKRNGDVPFCNAFLFDDFDLFNGELLRMASEDEVLRDV